MEKLVTKGLVKAIGLSNFNSRQIDDIIGIASVKPAVLQVRQSGGKVKQRKSMQVVFEKVLMVLVELRERCAIKMTSSVLEKHQRFIICY